MIPHTRSATEDLRWVLSSRKLRSIPPPLRLAARELTVRSRYRGLTDADVLVAGFPKSGSTWLRFVLLDLFTGNESGDFDAVDRASPAVGDHATAPKINPLGGRLLKTHEKYVFGSGSGSRAICMVRDPRDLVVSLFHYIRRNHVADIDIGQVASAFASGKLLPYGDWGEHITGWLLAADEAPDLVAVVRYEDLVQLGETALVDPIARLGLNFDVAEIGAAMKRNTAAEMRKKELATPSSSFIEGRGDREVSTPFVRAARSGQWNDALPEFDAQRVSDTFEPLLLRLGYNH